MRPKNAVTDKRTGVGSLGWVYSNGVKTALCMEGLYTRDPLHNLLGAPSALKEIIPSVTQV